MPHNKHPYHFSWPAAIIAGKLFTLVLQKQSDRLDLCTDIMGGIPWSSREVIWSDQNSKETVLGWLEDEEERDVDKCEDFAILDM